MQPTSEVGVKCGCRRLSMPLLRAALPLHGITSTPWVGPMKEHGPIRCHVERLSSSGHLLMDQTRPVTSGFH
jgi:hypothetical protein